MMTRGECGGLPSVARGSGAHFRARSSRLDKSNGMVHLPVCGTRNSVKYPILQILHHAYTLYSLAGGYQSHALADV